MKILLLCLCALAVESASRAPFNLKMPYLPGVDVEMRRPPWVVALMYVGPTCSELTENTFVKKNPWIVALNPGGWTLKRFIYVVEL